MAGSYDDHALAVFERDPMTGALAFLEVHKNGVAGVTGLVGCNGVARSSESSSH